MKSNCTVVLGIDATSAMRRNQPKDQYVNDWSPSNDASAAVNLRVEDGVYYSAQISGTRKYECRSSLAHVAVPEIRRMDIYIDV